MIWIILIVVIGLIVVATYNKKDETLKHQVDRYGGMSKKYDYLITKLTEHPKSCVKQVTRDKVIIVADGNSTKMTFTILEVYDKVQIDWLGNFNFLGNHKHKWTYPHTYPQEKMFSEISDFLEIKMKEVFNI